MSAEDRQRWDGKYAAKQVPPDLTADEWLRENATALPCGRAAELACGFGQNAIWLAQHGWQVEAIDVSPVGLRLAAAAAPDDLSGLHWIAADLDSFTPLRAAYDLIVVFRFLDRDRLPAMIVEALKPGGHLIYETFSAGQLDRADNHLRNPRFTLAPGELPQLYDALEVVRHEEVELADRTVARLLARKPAG